MEILLLLFMRVDGGLLSQQRSPQVDIFPLSRSPKLEGE